MSQDDNIEAGPSNPFACPMEDGSRRSSRFGDHPTVRRYRQSYEQRTAADEWCARRDEEASSSSTEQSILGVALHEELRRSQSRERLINPFEADDNIHFNHAIWAATAADEEPQIGEVRNVNTSTDIHAAAIVQRDVLFANVKRFESEQGQEKSRRSQRKESIIDFGRKTWRKMSSVFRKDSGYDSQGSEDKKIGVASRNAGQDNEEMPLISRGRSSTAVSLEPSMLRSRIGIVSSVESVEGVAPGNSHFTVCAPEYEDALDSDNDVQSTAVSRKPSELLESRPLSQEFSADELNPFTLAEDKPYSGIVEAPHELSQASWDQAYGRKYSRGHFSEEAIDKVFAKAPGNSPKYNKSPAAQWRASAILRAGTTAWKERRERAYRRLQKRMNIGTRLFRSRTTSTPAARDPSCEPDRMSDSASVGNVVGEAMRRAGPGPGYI